MIVVDASATLAWLFDERDPIDWLEDRLTNDRLIVPALWRLEVVNAILKKERQHLITEEQGTGQLLPNNLLRIENRSLDTGALVVPADVVGGTVVANASDATKADADAAGHGRFERDFTSNTPRRAEFGDGLHHRLGAATDDANV